jgi:hypothetical protein
LLTDDEEDAEVDDEDNLDEIDPANIIVESGGRRTRGKVIDFAKAAENTPADEEDEEEDDDYEAPHVGGDDEMEH